jgi:hypothetical protein
VRHHLICGRIGRVSSVGAGKRRRTTGCSGRRRRVGAPPLIRVFARQRMDETGPAGMTAGKASEAASRRR